MPPDDSPLQSKDPSEGDAGGTPPPTIAVPALRGAALRLVAALLETPARGLVTAVLARTFGLPAFRALRLDETPIQYPIHFAREPAAPSARIPQADWPADRDTSGPGFQFATVHDYAAAYRAGRTTPEAVAQRVIEAIDASDAAEPPLRAFVAANREAVLRQAEAATARIREGKALSLFDGVPVSVKDEVDMVPYGTTVGTGFLGRAPATADATVVARLRAAGALLVGKTTMHEIGFGVTGLNVYQGTARNPYAPGHYCGGSSSGSAAAVAAGFCPVALGADGGGSIRIPAALCGIVGLKPTFGRLSEHGAAPLCWSVAHLGPMAATATDAALGYAVMAGADPKDPNSLHQPPPTLEGWNSIDLTGLKLGVCRPWFRHADPEVIATCKDLLRRFETSGAVVREIALPDLEAARLAHVVTISSEMAHAVDCVHGARRQKFNLDVRLNLAVARTLTSSDFLRAQQVRTRMIAHFRRAFESVDAIVTPATAITAPRIKESAARGGESDLTTATELMRFVTPANLTGHPAISFPAGYSRDSLPIGMQAIGRPWDEATLLRLALAAEQFVERRAPTVFHRILDPR
jgi:Asp-tRNA(Asn)/Glu-tRNA(Gln) amidotransferase A subunit family amidase